MLMLLFVYVFGGAIETGSVKDIDYIVPGIILMCIARSSVLAGHVLTSLVLKTVSVALILL